MKSTFHKELELFNAARELAPGPEREAYLARVCNADEGLMARIQALLAGHESAGSFLGHAPTALGPNGTAVIGLTEKTGDQIERYKLLQEIGSGGCGVVYMAEQCEPIRRRVALKIIKPGLDTKRVIARFEAERQALAMMDHPNIAKVFDGGTTESGRPYFVMELVRGIPITEYCDQAEFTTEERLKLFIQVCQAVQHAHQKGVIHRDLKPSNVLVTVDNDVALPKVIDFGIAKATDQRLTEKSYFTEFQSFLGTPAYTSPEQAEMSSLDIDTRSDIYSLGVLLYELLTGQTPFPSERLLRSGLDEMRRIIREEEPQPPSARLTTLGLADATGLSSRRKSKIPQLANALQGDIDWIVMKALEKDRGRRYATSLDFAADLQRHLNHETVLARPPSLVYRFQRVVLRNKAAFVAASSVLAALVCGLTISIWSLTKERHARQRAVDAEKDQRRLVTVAENERARAAEERGVALAEKERADLQARIATQNVERLKIQKAGDLLRNDNTSLGLGLLAQVLRTNPSNRVAAERIISALTHRSFMVPLFDVPGARIVEYVPDGSRLAVVTGDELRLINSRSGRVDVGPVSLPHSVEGLSFSSDGTQFLIHATNHVSLWRTSDLNKLVEMPAIDEPVRSIHFTPSGPRIVSLRSKLNSSSSTSEYAFTIWKLDGSKLFGPVQHKWIHSVHFSPDGNRVLAVSHNTDLRVWDAKTGDALAEEFSGGGSNPSIAFSPDGKRFAVGSYGSLVGYIFNSDMPTAGSLALPHSSAIRCVGFSPDGRFVATGGSDTIARVWDASTGKLISGSIHADREIRQIEFDATSKYLVTASADRTVRVWDVATGRPIRESIRCVERIESIRVSPDGTSILISTEKDDQVWDLRPGQALSQTTFRPNGKDWRSVVSPDGTLKVKLSGEYNGSPTRMQLFDPHRETPASARLCYEANIFCAKFSPDSQRIALAVGLVNGPARGRAEILDRSGKRLFELSANDWGILDIDFSPDGRKIATGAKTMHAQVWDGETGTPITPPLKHGTDVESVRLSPDGRKLLTIGGAIARVWNAETGGLLFALHHEGEVFEGVWSESGRFIASGSQDASCRVWDAQDGRLLQDLRHPTAVRCVAFDRDEMRIATGSTDGEVRMWDVNIGEEISEPLRSGSPPHRGAVFSIRFVEDGRRLEVRGPSAEHVWEVPSPRLPMPWIAELAEAIGGQRLGELMQVERVSSSNLFTLKRRSTPHSGDTSQDPWLQWFFSDRLSRRLSPMAPTSVSEQFEELLRHRTQISYDWLALEELVRDRPSSIPLILESRERENQAQRAIALCKDGDKSLEESAFSEAAVSYREALKIRSSLFGSTHPLVGETLERLVYLLHRKLHLFAEAETYYTQLLTIKRGLSADHSDIPNLLHGYAESLIKQGKLAEAEAVFRQEVKLRLDDIDPGTGWMGVEELQKALVDLLVVRRDLKQPHGLGDFEQLILIRGNDALLNGLAWTLATSRDEKVRDGNLAVIFAEAAVRLSNRGNGAQLDTLAAAYAETGRFEVAQRTQIEAISRLGASENKDAYLRRLKLYEASTPFHRE